MKNTYEIEFTHWAESDLDEIAIYIAENDDISIAARFDSRAVTRKRMKTNTNEFAQHIGSPRRGVSKAVRVYLKLKEKILNLTESPYRGRIVPELKRIKVMDYREIIVNPYRIIYRVENKAVTIFAVFDGRRQIDDIIYQRVTGL
jgi:toxin ParE1/3/4